MMMMMMMMMMMVMMILLAFLLLLMWWRSSPMWTYMVLEADQMSMGFKATGMDLPATSVIDSCPRRFQAHAHGVRKGSETLKRVSSRGPRPSPRKLRDQAGRNHFPDLHRQASKRPRPVGTRGFWTSFVDFPMSFPPLFEAFSSDRSL